MVGGISATKEDLTDLTMGLEYEYRLNQRFGIGVLGEVVFGDQVRDGVLGHREDERPWPRGSHRHPQVVPGGGGVGQYPPRRGDQDRSRAAEEARDVRAKLRGEA